MERGVLSGRSDLLAAEAVVTFLDASSVRADQTVQVGPGTSFTISPGETERRAPIVREPAACVILVDK
jgi:hypothetical protein